LEIWAFKIEGRQIEMIVKSRTFFINSRFCLRKWTFIFDSTLL